MSIRGASQLGRRSRIAGALVGCAAAAAIVLPSAASAVPAGFDLFETDPTQTAVNFGAAPIPADFFSPGSQPFAGNVHFAGVPLETFGGKATGDADTVVRRLADAMLGPVFPDSDTIPIEIVALNLTSVEPITVTYAGGRPPELWDVKVQLVPGPPGQMTINQQNPNGGTFDSQLPVQATFVFTRLSDGARRTQPEPPLPFNSVNSPWRAGCVPPALRIVGLNDLFCPGLTPGGQKVLTVEDAAFARHGVYPVQPALEHFKCYVTAPVPFNPRQVALQDQFGGRNANIPARKELCNPVRKRAEPFQNRAAHLQCYLTRSPAVNKVVAVQNQFGSQRLRVGRAQRLCLPSRKNKPGRTAPQISAQQQIDHFQCYAVQGVTGLRRLGPIGKVKLRDQFGKRRVRIGPAFRLCAPVEKNNAAVLHPVRHLVCYRLRMRRRARLAPYAYGIKNQFERNPALRTVRRQSLCVPSLKVVIN